MFVCLVCGKVLKSYSGYVYHPNYPQPYKNNVNCLWTVQAPVNFNIRLEFKFFKIEKSFNCNNDYITVYDGANDNAPIIGKYCGRDLPANIVSTGNTISVGMKTNDRISDQGFVTLYKRVSGGLTPTSSRPTATGTY